MAGPLKKLDDAYYRVEKAVVVFALAVMSVTVFLDVAHRRLSGESSTITSVILWPKTLAARSAARADIGGGKKHATAVDERVDAELAPARKWLDAWVSPRLLVLLMFGVVLFALRTASERRGRSLIVVALAVTAGLAVFAKLMVTAESRWTYVTLVGAAGLIAARTARRANNPARAAVSAAAGLALAGVAYAIVPEGFGWAGEVSQNLLLWVGFIGASMATYSRRHIMVDFVRKMVPDGGARRVYEGLSALIAVAFCVLLSYLSYLYVFGYEHSIYRLGSRLDFSGLPMWLGVAAIPIGIFTSGLRFAAIGVQAVRGHVQTVEEPFAAVARDDAGAGE